MLTQETKMHLDSMREDIDLWRDAMQRVQKYRFLTNGYADHNRVGSCPISVTPDEYKHPERFLSAAYEEARESKDRIVDAFCVNGFKELSSENRIVFTKGGLVFKVCYGFDLNYGPQNVSEVDVLSKAEDQQLDNGMWVKFPRLVESLWDNHELIVLTPLVHPLDWDELECEGMLDEYYDECSYPVNEIASGLGMDADMDFGRNILMNSDREVWIIDCGYRPELYDKYEWLAA